MNEAVRLH